MVGERGVAVGPGLPGVLLALWFVIAGLTAADADGRLLFFHMEGAHGGALYSIGADGADLRKLADFGSFAAASPDGRFIAAVGNDGDLYVMAADGSSPRKIASSDAGIKWPAWSPDGTQIAFEGPDGHSIYVCGVDGSGLRKAVSDRRHFYQHPDWSPDGRWLVVSSTDPGRPSATVGGHEICIVGADGSGLRPLTADGELNRSPAWSPDGRSIVFASRAGMGLRTFDLFLIGPDGSGRRNLTGRRAAYWNPVWSPDGSMIAYTGDPEGAMVVYVVNADGSGRRRVPNVPANSYIQAWAPDVSAPQPEPRVAEEREVEHRPMGPPDEGQAAAAGPPAGTVSSQAELSFRSGREPPGLYVMGADRSNLRRICDTPELATVGGYTWAPDGSRVVCSLRDGAGDALWIFNPDGTGKRRLTQCPGPDGSGQDGQPSWSPDGAWIAFRRHYLDERNAMQDDIWVIRPDGTGLRRLTTEPGGAGGPQWSPDNSMIAYTYGRNEDYAVHVVALDGSGVRRITPPGEQSSGPRWFPDGSGLFYFSRPTWEAPSDV